MTDTNETLKITDLHVAVGEKLILRGVDLVIRRGETHALMGPNGCGKSTLGLAVMGHPTYEVTEGTIELDGRDLLELGVPSGPLMGHILRDLRDARIDGLVDTEDEERGLARELLARGGQPGHG